MKRSFLGRLQRTALLNLIGVLLLLLIVPGLQLALLGPQGYSTALASPLASLVWIQGHLSLFLPYRLALILGFVFLLGLPFALFRIIVAQEIIGRAELENQKDDELEDAEEDDEEADADQQTRTKPALEENGLPMFAWRGKGFAVIGAWTGLLGLLSIAGGTLASTLYLWSSAASSGTPARLPGNFADVTSIFAVLAYTIGGGLLTLSCIFFGLAIARSGRKLWPDAWVAFGYAALIVGVISSGSAVQVALAPTSGQATLTTPAILLFAAWSLWFGIMVARLKAE